MEINSNSTYQASINIKSSMSYQQQVQERTDSIKEMASKVDGNQLTQQYALQFQMDIKINIESNTAGQNALWNFDPDAARAILGGYDFSTIGYEGKPLDEISSDEAAELISEDGFFGIENTAQRIADFVIMGAGDNLARLKEGREGALKGYDEAESVFGGSLPDISQQTIERAMELIDARISELGGSVLDTEA